MKHGIWIVVAIGVMYCTSACQALAALVPTPTPQPSHTPAPTYTPQATYTAQATYTPVPSETLQPSLTPSPEPTALPTAEAMVLLQEIFEQGGLCFGEETLGFYGAGRFSENQVVSGAYQMQVSAERGEVYVALCRSLSMTAFTIETQATFDGGPGTPGYGIAIWSNPGTFLGVKDRLLFTFLINEQGEYCVFRHAVYDNRYNQSGSYRLAGCWTKVPGRFIRNGPNHLKVEIGTDKYRFYVNGELAATVANPDPDSIQFNPGSDNGIAGLAVGMSGKAGRLMVRFDDVLITSAPYIPRE